MTSPGPIALTLLATLISASVAAAQESVFNLPGFGLPGTGESMRARGMGGVAVGSADEIFSVDNPALAGHFRRAGFYVSLLGHDAELESPELTHSSDDVVFPMGQAVFPSLSGTVFSVGFYQFVDFDAAVESTIVFEGDTLPASFDSDGGLFVIAPALAYALDENTSVGAGLDVYLGSREVIRSVETPDRVGVFTTTADSLERDFRALGVSLGVQRRVGGRADIAIGYRIRPSVSSEITRSAGDLLTERESDFDLPNALVVGASVDLSETLRAATALRHSGWESFTIDGEAQADAEDEIEFGLGLEFTPRESTALLLGPESPLRVGWRWRRLPVRIDDDSVAEWVGSLGYTRRFGPRSRVDVLLEYGRRGSIDTNGLSERFLRLGIGVAAFEQWRRRTS